ncbi:tryptophan transporter [Pueribacillus theae]|uniref:Tryptophan transporter n=1 Tax=Pueribacillus theae TaxID=2171751 RepID=A0A2U1K3Q0_9BACI|nr:tryptophan transporter [Pueribacillus theae]PWA11804.1 tryptophan transporter [Pueribacillus theae]
MKTKNLVLIALLLGMGTVLSLILAVTFAGMRPDVLLVMMFIAILLFPEKKHVLLTGLLTGILSGLISTFPGGFIPNIIDKLITAFVCLGLVLMLQKLTPIVRAGIISVIGTFVSGIVFLSSALIIVSLPAPFLALFNLVVLPALALNTILIVIVYPIVQSVLKRSNFEPIQRAV